MSQVKEPRLERQPKDWPEWGGQERGQQGPLQEACCPLSWQQEGSVGQTQHPEAGCGLTLCWVMGQALRGKETTQAEGDPLEESGRPP